MIDIICRADLNVNPGFTYYDLQFHSDAHSSVESSVVLCQFDFYNQENDIRIMKPDRRQEDNKGIYHPERSVRITKATFRLRG